MKIGAIVQARMSSTRFPGKTMYNVKNKPLLGYLMERLYHCNCLDNIVVATSREPGESPIIDYCNKEKINFFTGSLYDVARRFVEVLNIYKFDAFVRVNGDSPLLCHELIDKGVDIFLKGDFDVVTNIYNRTYPKGQSVEIVRTEIFCNTYNLMKESDDLEHVTKYFYKHHDNFNIYNFISENNYGDLQLSVDTIYDMEVFKKIIHTMKKPHWNYKLDEIIQIYQELEL